MSRCLRIAACTFILGLAFSGCAPEEDDTPSRDQYPVINARVYDLQTAVMARDRVKIDSLLSAEILDAGQSSDSLLRFVYGPGDNFPFETFGECRIYQTDEVARVDCYVQDSSRAQDRPITFTFKLYADSVWLLQRFDPTPADGADETELDTADVPDDN